MGKQLESLRGLGHGDEIDPRSLDLPEQLAYGVIVARMVACSRWDVPYTTEFENRVLDVLGVVMDSQPKVLELAQRQHDRVLAGDFRAQLDENDGLNPVERVKGSLGEVLDRAGAADVEGMVEAVTMPGVNDAEVLQRLAEGLRAQTG